MSDRIEKSVELKASVSRVWRALTDHTEFGTWFRVKLDNPFVARQTTRGHITHPGYAPSVRGFREDHGARALIFIHLAPFRDRP